MNASIKRALVVDKLTVETLEVVIRHHILSFHCYADDSTIHQHKTLHSAPTWSNRQLSTRTKNLDDLQPPQTEQQYN